jgi:glycosyltransferase involved in cell wall biosynthesis
MAAWPVPWLLRWERQVLPECTAWTATDASLAGVLGERGGQGKPWAVIPPAVLDGDPAWSSATDAPVVQHRVAWSGSFDAFQGLALLAAAWPRVRAARPEAELLLVTHDRRPPPPSMDLPGVLWRRAGDWNEALRALRSAAVFCIPRSLSGGSPVKLFNALAMGRAVVVTRPALDGAVAPEAVEVAEATAPGLAAALLRCLDDPERCGRLGRRGRAEAQAQHRASLRAAPLLELYRRAMAACTPREASSSVRVDG